jgi:hypothetical protein
MLALSVGHDRPSYTESCLRFSAHRTSHSGIQKWLDPRLHERPCGRRSRKGLPRPEERIKEESKIVGEKAKQFREKVLPGEKENDSK